MKREFAELKQEMSHLKQDQLISENTVFDSGVVCELNALHEKFAGMKTIVDSAINWNKRAIGGLSKQQQQIADNARKQDQLNKNYFSDQHSINMSTQKRLVTIEKNQQLERNRSDAFLSSQTSRQADQSMRNSFDITNSGL